MADSDKDILITPNTGAAADPKIVFSSGATSGDPITLSTVDDGTTSTLSFEGSAGQLFSISNDLTGTIFSVADGSGIPSIEADADGTIRLAEFGGSINVGASILPNVNSNGTTGFDLGSPTFQFRDLYLGGDITATSFVKTSGTSTEFLKADGSVDTNTYLTSETSHSDVLVDGDFISSGFMKTNGSGGYSVDTNTYLTSETSHSDVLVDGDFTSNGFMRRIGPGSYTIDGGSYLPLGGGALTGALSIINGALGVGTAASTVTGEIRATNNITAYYSSDKRLKENIEPIENAVEKVKAISGVRFDWTEDYIKERGGEDDYFLRKKDVGVIAQEIQEVLPEAVAEREDTTLAVRYEKIVPLLIEAIKEQQKEIDKLKEILNES